MLRRISEKYWSACKISSDDAAVLVVAQVLEDGLATLNEKLEFICGALRDIDDRLSQLDKG